MPAVHLNNHVQIYYNIIKNNIILHSHKYQQLKGDEIVCGKNLSLKYDLDSIMTYFENYMKRNTT